MRTPPVSRHTVTRANILAVFLLVVFLLLALRIFLIQVIDFSRFQDKVFGQLTTESPVLAARGEILDTNGEVLATNRTAYRVVLFPKMAKTLQIDQDRFAREICEIFDTLTIGKVMEHLAKTTELERTLVRSTDREHAEKTLALIKNQGYSDLIAVEAINVRHYPFGSLAAQVLGFTGSDGQGLYGLELQYNEALTGKKGAYITARDSTGNPMPNQYEAFVEAEAGYTLRTTLDVFVQARLEEQLKATYIESQAKNRVCGIVMDPETGAILAMATYPAFDPNDPFSLSEECEAILAKRGALTLEEREGLARELMLETWSNKAVTEIYMPGSTFKTLTCSMAIEEKVVTDLQEKFFCSGALHVADRSIHCHKAGGHGSLTFEQGLQNSCNPVMMTIGARLGCERFYQYVKAFGFLEKTGIDLPGEGNSIFHAPSNFKELDLATASFGQNFKVSVMQMITAVSTVANGGELLKPYLVESIEDAHGNLVYEHERTVKRRVISEQTAATISSILEGGVSGEGGAKNAYVPGFRVAAKTGTSEKIGDDRLARIGSCVGYAPADAPRAAAIIVVDEPSDGIKYGSVVAAPYIARLFESILPYLGVAAKYTPEEEKELRVALPNCVGWQLNEALETLLRAGFDVQIVGEAGEISAQTPGAGERLVRGATVVLTMGKREEVKLQVPDLVGKSALEAVTLLSKSGFNFEIVGAKTINEAIVKKQYPSAGEILPFGGVVRLYFPYEGTGE